jgi:hypothetical protein
MYEDQSLVNEIDNRTKALVMYVMGTLTRLQEEKVIECPWRITDEGWPSYAAAEDFLTPRPPSFIELSAILEGIIGDDECEVETEILTALILRSREKFGTL